MRMKRGDRPGYYHTPDGLFTVWQSCSGDSYENLWNVSHDAFDESLTTGGFRTKWQAVKWLDELYEERPSWIPEWSGQAAKKE